MLLRLLSTTGGREAVLLSGVGKADGLPVQS